MQPRFVARLAAGSLAAYCAVAAFSRTARGDSSNPNVIPLGENESFLGNTGTGRANDTGAVYYNPAGLAELAGTVALSGTVYASVSEHYGALLQFQGVNIPFDASGYNAIPTAFVGTAKLGDWVGAFSVLAPISLQFEDRATLPIPNLVTNLVYSSSETEYWYGLSLARKLGRHFAVGLSVFGIQHGNTLIEAVDIESQTGSFGTALVRNNESVFGLLATLGVSYIATDRVRFGFRMQTAMAQIYGKGESYSITHPLPAAGAAAPAAFGEDVTGPANYAIPFDFSLGTAMKPAEWLTLLGDVSLQLPASYQEFPASMNNEAVSLQATPRLNLGVEAAPLSWVPVRLGFYYNPSARSGHPGDANFQSLDFFGVTAGIGTIREHVRTTLGGFYIWSSGQATSTAPASAPFNITAVGAMLTTAYVF